MDKILNFIPHLLYDQITFLVPIGITTSNQSIT